MDPPPPLGGLRWVRARLEIVNFEKKLKLQTGQLDTAQEQ
jgi:uncharacterized membrane protein YciS (DUF1049 family)